jgi:hypothetical protein
VTGLELVRQRVEAVHAPRANEVIWRRRRAKASPMPEDAPAPARDCRASPVRRMSWRVCGGLVAGW